ncbi:MAG: SMP-30/gluconolactonase/LRE family protein [Woeseia sp.]
MKRETETGGSALNRRSFLAASAMVSGALLARNSRAVERDWDGNTPVRYPDPDIVELDPRFARYKLGNAAIQRLHTGSLWTEGPAWNGVGRYLVWSDIPNDTQLRWAEEDGHVSSFRNPSGNSNGNTFDHQGRQISFEHGNRRVVRYEYDGTVSVLASHWQGKPLNAPNDGVVHPDGSLWFTDPGYGSMSNYEGTRRPLEIKEAVYRVDLDSGNMSVVTDELQKPNGLCFSPDYKKLYVTDTGGNAPLPIYSWDVVEGGTLRNRRTFCEMEYNDRTGGADGIRADVDGNIWAGAGWGGEGFDGVHVFAPDGDRIGAILLPEICSNLCFGGAKRNRLFITASQSLYAVYVNTSGAHIC